MKNRHILVNILLQNYLKFMIVLVNNYLIFKLSNIQKYLKKMIELVFIMLDVQFN